MSKTWSQVQEGALEKVCGRAALLAGDVEGHASAGLGLGLDGGMTDDPSEDERRGVEREITVPGGCDNRWVGGAVSRDRPKTGSGSGWLRRPRHARAVMCAVSSAAGRQICVGVGCEGQQRRDQRKAEEEEQRQAEKTSHNAIVTSFAGGFVIDPLFALVAT